MALNYTNPLDEATLAKQYDAIRRSEGPGSARSLRDSFRAGGFGDETQTFQGSGVRRAGWKDSAIAPESMPEVDAESRMLLGGRLGEMVSEGGQSRYGYYGDVDVFDRSKLDPWLKDTGFNYAKGPEDAEYVAAGLDLPSLWKNPLYKQGSYDFTQKYGYDGNKGVDDYMASLGFTHDLGKEFDLKSTGPITGLGDTFTKVKDYYGKQTYNDFLSGAGYNDYTDSEFADFTPFVNDAQFAQTGGRDWWTGDLNKFALGQTYDPRQYLKDNWNSTATPGTRLMTDSLDYNNTWNQDFFNYRGQDYNTLAEANAASTKTLQGALKLKPAQLGELVAQMRTKGQISDNGDPGNMQNFTLGANRGDFGGDRFANPLTLEDLKYVLGGRDVNYDNKALGTELNEVYDPHHQKWSEYKKKSSSSFLKKKKKYTWDYGDVQAGLAFKDPNYLTKNAFKTDDGMFLKSDLFNNTDPVAKAVDTYSREFGQKKISSLSGIGKVLSAVANFIPGVGPLISAGLNTYGSGTLNPTDIINAVIPNIPGLKDIGGLGSKALDAGVSSAISSGLGGLVSGQGFGDALKGAAIGGLSGAAGSYAGDTLGDYLTKNLTGVLPPSALKHAVAGLSGGANTLGRNITKSVLSGNRPTIDMAKASGLAALTGGIGSIGGSTLNEMFNPRNDATLRQDYNSLANSITGLGQRYFDQRQRDKVTRKRNNLQQAGLNRLVSKLSARRV